MSLTDLRPRILCVDDEPRVLDALRRTLGREPYDIVTLQSPVAALEFARRRSVDLVISDQRMPEMSGVDLLSAIGQCAPSAVRVMLTAYFESAADVQRRSLDIERLFTKPWDDDQLRSTLRDLLAHRPADPLVGVEDLDRLQRDVEELVLHVDCRGRPGSEVLARATDLFQRPEAPFVGCVALLENLQELDDSLGGLFKGLLRRVLMYGVRTCIVDPSGCAPVFLHVLGGPLPLVALPLRPRDAPPSRILVFEPRATGRIFLSRLLSLAGHEPEGLTTALAAQARLADARFDVALVDLDAAEAEALTLLHALADLDRRPSIVAVSSRHDRWSDSTFRRLGVTLRLPRPYRSRAILDAVGVDA